MKEEKNFLGDITIDDIFGIINLLKSEVKQNVEDITRFVYRKDKKTNERYIEIVIDETQEYDGKEKHPFVHKSILVYNFNLKIRNYEYHGKNNVEITEKNVSKEIVDKYIEMMKESVGIDYENAYDSLIVKKEKEEGLGL